MCSKALVHTKAVHLLCRGVRSAVGFMQGSRSVRVRDTGIEAGLGFNGPPDALFALVTCISAAPSLHRLPRAAGKHLVNPPVAQSGCGAFCD